VTLIGKWLPGQLASNRLQFRSCGGICLDFSAALKVLRSHYFLSEQKGNAENLKIINSRDIDFMVTAGRSGSVWRDTSLDGMSFFPSQCR